MSSTAYKPLGPSKIPMDTSKAMAILGFPSSQGFENTEMSEIKVARASIAEILWNKRHVLKLGSIKYRNYIMYMYIWQRVQIL
jgi:hypothetical protein